MTITFYGYPKCSSCKKAEKWLEAKGVQVDYVNIAEQPPTEEVLRTFIEQSGLDIKKFFNVSGMKYRELQLKDKLPEMSADEKLALLSSDGMLIKRPIATDGKKVTVGFNETQYEDIWGKE
ncbi:arsenate reductase family protein [Sporosarcina sp. Te-1]|uniref:arsenate reductase family protein n=1 Tax=Sporosarcina sp. Te-1 TaxID=2818390 RepID=UPI001A9D5923|nr:arsenate reductase family protein [Sporosarcina sp. Te-1]QTD43361.1 arsenate reductase family protein [Sporosarcina sp. Te-1]